MKKITYILAAAIFIVGCTAKGNKAPEAWCPRAWRSLT